MAITEGNRHDLYVGLEELLGTERATVLMEHLPPVGWADVATKRDLDHFAEVLRLEWRAELHLATRNLVFAMLAAMTAQTGILLALIRG